MASPQRIKNSEFQTGGIYPGGTGIVTDIGYKLWDYNGSRPKESEMCVEMIFSPTDGGNEGKPVVINWNVGPANVFQPDPGNNGFALDVSGVGRKMSDNCNWHFARETGFVKNCAMPEDATDGPSGLKALIGSELTLVRMDPPRRDGLQAQQAQPGPDGKPARVNQVLIPTRAKFAWEKKGAGAGRSTGATVAAANGASNGAGGDLSSYMEQILTEEGGALDMSDFTKKLMEKLTLVGVKGKERINIVKQSKDADAMKSIAAAKGWTFEDLTIQADGKMEGTLSA